ncbi:hypothetical protein [Pseudomonas shirazensis]
MKILGLLISLFFCLNLYSQDKFCRINIFNTEELVQKDEIEKFQKYNFSSVWTTTEDNVIFGVIGSNYQRILIKFISVKRDEKHQNEYIVYGKSQVKSNTCNFVGKITITKIQEVKNPKFGVDDEYKNAGIKKQALLIAKYKFVENNNQKDSGDFQGILQSIFYLDKDNVVKYNDIEINSDKYFNNAFVGTWRAHNSVKEKICNWADYRVPNVNCDFDIGTGEFTVSEKYSRNGWWIKPKQNWWK